MVKNKLQFENRLDLSTFVEMDSALGLGELGGECRIRGELIYANALGS